MTTAVHCDSFTFSLEKGLDIRDITPELTRILSNLGIFNGGLQAMVEGSTGSLSCIEFEPGVIQDLCDTINRLAPPGGSYAHELAWHEGNGHSHVQAALLGPSLCIAVRQGRLTLGTWQQVICINHDNKPRTRRVHVTIIGSAQMDPTAGKP